MKQDLTTIKTFRENRKKRSGRGNYVNLDPSWDIIASYIYHDVVKEGIPTNPNLQIKYGVGLSTIEKAVDWGIAKEMSNKSRRVNLVGKQESYWSSEEEIFYNHCTADDLQGDEKIILERLERHDKK